MAQTLYSLEILNEDDVKAAIRKLGWQSSYSRRILLTRFLLRSLASLDHLPEDIPEDLRRHLLLKTLKSSIHILSTERENSTPYAAPYEPQGRPATFYLSVSRQFRFFSVSIENSLSAGFRFPEVKRTNIREVQVNHISWEELDFQLLAHEVREVGKNVSLFNKHLGDKRCEELLGKPL
jgi:hypothetical protein